MRGSGIRGEGEEWSERERVRGGKGIEGWGWRRGCGLGIEGGAGPGLLAISPAVGWD